MKTKIVQTSKEHTAFRDDMLKVLKKHQHMDPQAMLAVASNLVGQLIAMQDQRKLSPDAVMEVVQSNIELGNAAAIATIFGEVKGTA